jgi:hypothetical protein
MHTLLRHVFAVKRIWQLDQDTCAITHQGIGTDRTTVIQVLQNLQGLADDFVGFVTFDMGDKTYATSIVLLVGLV